MARIASLPVRTERERQRLIDALSSRELPFTVSVKSGVPRTIAQNRMNRQWCNDAAEQGDMTAEEYRGLLKLTIGVPILRSENEAFRVAYDEHVKGLPYETKLALMMEPLDFPVTRLMDADQESRYLDGCHQYLTVQCGFVITDPGEPGVMR
jgi:hypothetical protein